MEGRRPYDVVLLGATGFTGRLITEQLARMQPPLRWAIAGRDAGKIRDVKAALVGAQHDAGAVGTMVADCADRNALRSLARQTYVVANAVGPYLRYGDPVVAACVEEGAHYLDITGETDFHRQTLQRWNRRARDAGLKVVTGCGFDSIPADVGTHYVVQQLSRGPREVRAYLNVRAEISGGTWASLLETLSQGTRMRTGLRRPRRTQPRGWHRAPRVAGEGWALPLPVADPTVVRRTAAVLPEVYGSDFTYGHYLRVPSRRAAARLGLTVAGVSTASWLPFGTTLLARRRPTGTGPSDEERARSFFELTLVGEAAGQRVVARVVGGDPGYTETSRMFAICVDLLCRHPDRLPQRNGVLTPVLAFGEELRHRLVQGGIRITHPQAGV